MAVGRARRSTAGRQALSGSAIDGDGLAALQRALGYAFSDRALLERALVHRSYLNEPKGAGLESNERLEFLGDAVLGFVVARELYRRFPESQEGQLTELRAHLVRWETLGEVGASLPLGDHLQMAHGEARSGGRTRPLNLARVYEALVGAIHEDGTLRDAERFILRTLKPLLDELDAHSVVSDVKSRLQTLTQAEHGSAPVYRTVDVSGPDHDRSYRVQVLLGERVLGEGVGRSKRVAEKAAAAEALRRQPSDG